MLTPIEMILFTVLVIASLAVAYRGFNQLWRIVMRGEDQLALDHLLPRAIKALRVYLTQQTTLKTRRLSSIIHVGVAWGFTFFFLVNFGDLLEGFIPGFKFLGTGAIGDAYHLLGDLFSVAVLVGVAYFLVRRFIVNDAALTFRENILLHPKVAAGAIRRDSLIVGGFILLHVGARFLGEAVQVRSAMVEGLPYSAYQPFAIAASGLFNGFNANALMIAEHFFWWLSLGGILAFIPYFAYSKHAHIFMAPLNILTKPTRTSLGALPPEPFEDETREQFGAHKLEHLPKTHLVDALACIQCNRCQDVCPAYLTGKELSPAAYEINKRYMIREEMSQLATGAESAHPLMGWALSQSAVWGCTACGACVDICPVGNEPMFDILDIRRDQVLVQAEFPTELKGAFNGMERQGNPWQMSESRLAWAEGLNVPTTDENPTPDVLYWVGCAASYEPRARQTARSLVEVLRAAKVDFAVLGDRESCTGDTARRAGNEFLYTEMAKANVETLNEIAPKRIVVTCPHCFHNIGKEYPQFGGNYEIVHHTQLLEELIAEGKLPATAHPDKQPNVTFHDPCYLGRHNDVIDEPRAVLTHTGASLVEMPRNKRNSFCCGAGGAQFWKEEEHGSARVNVTRFEEAKATGADTLAVGCPFCMRMFSDASAEVGGGPVVKDIVEIVAERLHAPKP